MTRSRRKRKYKKILLIYTIIAMCLCVVFIIYIFITLKTYEKNQITNFIKTSIANLDDSTLKEYLKDNNLDESLLKDYGELIRDKDIIIKKKDENNFEATLNKRTLFDIETKYLKTETKLGMFSYEIRKITKIIPNLDRGLIYYDITAPSTYKIIVDGKEIEQAAKTEKYKNLDFMYLNTSMPYIKTYEINNLTKEVNVEAIDEYGEKVNLEKNKFSYKVKDNYLKFDNYEKAKKYLSSEIDIWTFVHDWSLFLTDDLGGLAHGYNKIKEYFIDGSEISRRAYNWAHEVDITFTSKHTLKDPIFTNEKLNNFIIYSKDAFSCEVYSEKNMLVNNQDQKDTLHDYIYFIKDNNTWKITNIRAGE